MRCGRTWRFSSSVKTERWTPCSRPNGFCRVSSHWADRQSPTDDCTLSPLRLLTFLYVPTDRQSTYIYVSLDIHRSIDVCSMQLDHHDCASGWRYSLRQSFLICHVKNCCNVKFAFVVLHRVVLILAVASEAIYKCEGPIFRREKNGLCPHFILWASHKSLERWLTCRFYTILLMWISVSENETVCYIVDNAITNAKVRGPGKAVLACLGALGPPGWWGPMVRGGRHSPLCQRIRQCTVRPQLGSDMSNYKMVLKLPKSTKTGDWRDVNVAQKVNCETTQLGHTHTYSWRIQPLIPSQFKPWYQHSTSCRPISNSNSQVKVYSS